MRWIWLAMIACCVGGMFSSPAEAGTEKKSVAVLNFQVKGDLEVERIGAVLTDWCRDELFITGRVKVAGRAEVNTALAKLKGKEGRELSLQDLVQLGRLLGAQYVIAGEGVRLSERGELNARIYDVESAGLLAVETVSAPTAMDSRSAMQQLTQAILSHFPVRGLVISRQGDVVMLDVGKDKGVQPGMSFEAFSQGEPILHPVSGEVLDAGLLKTGEIQIVEAKNKISTGRVLVDGAGTAVSVGNTVENISFSVVPVAEEERALAGQDLIAPATEGREALAGTAVVQSDGDYPDIRKELLSESAERVRGAARKIVSRSILDETVLRTAADVLRKGYRRSGDRTHIDAMAWLCKAVGLSKGAEYSDLLREITELSRHSKLRKYASASLQSGQAVSVENVDGFMVKEGTVTVVLFGHRHTYPDVYKDLTQVQINGQSLRSISRKTRYVLQLSSGRHEIALRGAKTGWEILRLDGKSGNIYFIDTVPKRGGHDPMPVLLSQLTGMKKVADYRLQREYVEKQDGQVSEVRIGTVKLVRK